MVAWGRAHIGYGCMRIRIIAGRWCRVKKRSRAVRGRVSRIARIALRIALSEDRVSMGRLRWRGLVDNPWAYWLLVASATSEATFPKVTLSNGVPSRKTSDTTTEGVKPGFSLRTCLVGFTESRAMGPLAEQAGGSFSGSMGFRLARESRTFLLTKGSRWARLTDAIARRCRASFWPRGSNRWWSLCLGSWNYLWGWNCLWGSGLRGLDGRRWGY